jgi:predicted dehydrogenase
MDTVRWGIIGAGAVCEVKSGPPLYKCDRSELVAVMRRTESKAADFAKRHDVKRFYSKVDELINDEEVNAIYIATPPGTHLDLALECLKSRKPCYIEKPLARNASETEQIVNAFRDAKVPLFSAYYRRGQEHFRLLKKMIADGKIGTVVHVSYEMLRPYVPNIEDRWRLKSESSGGGLIMDVGVHTLDILDYLVGPITGAKGHATNITGKYKVEDTVSMSFRIGDTALGTAAWTFAGSSYKDKIVIRGERGTLEFSTFTEEPIRLLTPGPEDFNVQNVTEIPFELPTHAQQPLIQTIVDDLVSQGAKPAPSTGDNALRVARVVDAVLESYYGGRGDSFWDREASWPGAPKELQNI